MQALQKVALQLDSHQNSFEKSSLSPFLAKTLKVSEFECVSYCQRHNMIIASCSDFTIKFYDAITLMPLEGRNTLQLDGRGAQMTYYEETDTFILECRSGLADYIYTYHVSSHQLKRLWASEWNIQRVVFVSSRFYVFGLHCSGLLIGDLDKDNGNDDNDDCITNSRNNDCKTLEYLPGRSLLLSSFEDNFLRIYGTNKLPSLKSLCSIKGCSAGKWIFATGIISVNGKEYIVAGGTDGTVRIWHLVKGRIRLLKVIQTEGRVYRFVYLENYKMIATIYEDSNKIDFWKIFSGKLEKTFVCKKNKAIWSLFLMKDKNVIVAIGGARGNFDFIEFIQLYRPEERY